MLSSLRSRPSQDVDTQNTSEIPRVRHRNHHVSSPIDNDSTNAQKQTRPSLSINTQLNGSHGQLPNVRTTSTHATLASPKLHGRRAAPIFERLERTTRYKMVLGGSLLVLSFCMTGLWMSSNNLHETRRHRSRDVQDGNKQYVSNFSGKIGHERDINNVWQKKHRVGELYRPSSESHKRKPQPAHWHRVDKPDPAKWEGGKRERADQPSESRRNEISTGDDSESDITFLVQSSHIDPPSNDVDMRMWGYTSRPRALHCDFQLIHAKPQFGDDNGATLKSVNSLPTHETEQLLHSSRFVSSYPDDDEHLMRRSGIKRNSKKYRLYEAEPFEEAECKAKHDWQIGAFPNCNNLHEFELGQLTTMHGRAMREALNVREGDGNEQVRYWAHGFWRDVWLVSKALSAKHEEIGVLKTLRMQHDFTDRNYDRHRKDALASERLSKSPYVVDIYAYCSNSAIFEYGDKGDIDMRIWPYDKKAKKHYVAELSSLEKIDISFQVARAIADIHDAEDDGFPSIVHTDITPTQFIFIDGKYKVNDFNRCRFMRVNTTDNSECGFHVGVNPGKFRAPEEYFYQEENEKVDIYSMGNIFYAILSGDMPFEDIGQEEAQELVKDGKRPDISDDILNNNDIAVKTILSIIKQCWEQDPADRPSASYVRDELKRVMDGMTSNNSD